jgi:hypothetical protein
MTRQWRVAIAIVGNAGSTPATPATTRIIQQLIVNNFHPSPVKLSENLFMFVMPTEKRVMTQTTYIVKKITHLIRGWFLLAQITLPALFLVGIFLIGGKK